MLANYQQVAPETIIEGYFFGLSKRSVQIA